MSSYTLIGQAIVDIINANVTKTTAVYNYAEPTPAGYPAINVEAFDGNAVFADTTRNRRQYIFKITCLQERINVKPSEAERITRALVDQILDIFDSRTNLTLNNTCDFCRPIPSKFGYQQAPDIDVRAGEILLVAEVIQ